MAKNPFKSVARATRTANKAMNLDRTSDFKVTQQGLDAIMGNMLTTQTGLGSSASRENLRTITQMGRFSDLQVGKLRAGPGKAQTAITNRFGAALGDVAGAATAEARVTAKAGAGATRAAARLGADLGTAGSAAMDISQQFAKAAVGSGNYELAQALAYRAKNDAELQSERQLALAQAKLDYKLQWDMFKKQNEFQTKQLEKAQLQGLGRLTETLPGALFDIETAMSSGDNITVTDAAGKETAVDPKTADPTQVAMAMASQYGISDQGALQVLTQAVVNMQKFNMAPDEALTSAITSLYGDVKGFDKASIGLDKTIALSVLARSRQQFITDLEASLGDDGAGVANLGTGEAVPANFGGARLSLSY